MDLYSKGSNSPPLLRAEKEMTKIGYNTIYTIIGAKIS